MGTPQNYVTFKIKVVSTFCDLAWWGHKNVVYTVITLSHLVPLHIPSHPCAVTPTLAPSCPCTFTPTLVPSHLPSCPHILCALTSILMPLYPCHPHTLMNALTPFIPCIAHTLGCKGRRAQGQDGERVCVKVGSEGHKGRRV